MRKKSGEKAVKSYEKKIIEHYKKIKKEKLRGYPNKGIISYWEKEIEGLRRNQNKHIKKMY